MKKNNQKAGADAPAPQTRDFAALVYGDNTPSDSELLDYIDYLAEEEGDGNNWILRGSMIGRGWRLHQSSSHRGTAKVRDAIVQHMVDRFTRDDSDIEPPDQQERE